MNFHVEYHIGDAWSFSGFYTWRHIMYMSSLLDMLILIIWASCCLILQRVFTVIYPFTIINSLLGTTFRTWKYFAAPQHFL